MLFYFQVECSLHVVMMTIINLLDFIPTVTKLIYIGMMYYFQVASVFCINIIYF